MFDSSGSASSALNSARAASRSLGMLNAKLLQTCGPGGSADVPVWDDEHAYYKAEVGESLGDRYLVADSNCGRGMCASIVKARDQAGAGGCLVAIKIARSLPVMHEAAEKELEIFRRLQECEVEGRKYIVNLLSSFTYRGHLCLVFECLWDDLREALRRCTKGRGMTLTAVRSYSQQLLMAVRHVHRCGILHADIKPDNILISEDLKLVKLCDFGTAMDLKDLLSKSCERCIC